jgi:hypothetical protein
MSVQVGGNKHLFDLMKEYEIGELVIPMRYRHAALKWFRRRHLAKLDGRDHYFNEAPPAKNLNQRVDKTKALIK